MADYIEREAAIKLIAEDKVEITPLLCAITQAYTAEQAFDGLNQSCDRHIKFINSIPSADVQPVLRCKDCKEWHRNYLAIDGGKHGCELFQDFTRPDDFCSFGTRMDGVT